MSFISGADHFRELNFQLIVLKSQSLMKNCADNIFGTKPIICVWRSGFLEHPILKVKTLSNEPGVLFNFLLPYLNFYLDTILKH